MLTSRTNCGIEVRTNCGIQTNSVEPDQEQSDLGQHCLLATETANGTVDDSWYCRVCV